MAHSSDYPMSVPTDFSNLEVIWQRTDEGFKEVQQTPEKLLVPFEDSKEVHIAKSSLISQLWGKSFDTSHPPTISPPSAPSSLSSSTTLFPEGKQCAKKICGLPIKVFWILLAATMVVIALAVGIPVGLYARGNGGSSRQSPANGSDLSAAPKPSSTSASTPLPAPLTLNNDSAGIASVAWNDTNGVMQYRVYSQDHQQAIKESAWNASGQKWQETQSIGVAKARTPITAAVTGPQDFSFELSVYALGDNGSIIEWTTKDSKSFQTGNMTSENIKPASGSSLTALWDRHHGCPQCGNSLLFAYQRSDDGRLEVGNYTSSGWNWTTLQSNPAPNTGLALALRWQSTAAGDLRLFYQTKDGHLVSQDYNGPHTPPSFIWISREPGPIAQLNSISPLTTFTYGSTSTGDALSNDIISANSSGLTVNWWSGIYAINGPEESPSAMTLVDATALAANEDKHFYALQRNGTIAEFEMLNDEYHWAYVGTVNPG